MSHKYNYIVSCFVFAFLDLLTRLEIFLQTSYNRVFCILYIHVIVTYLVGSCMGSGLGIFSYTFVYTFYIRMMITYFLLHLQ